ncbi:hypothetical protein D9M68_733650 [compost metagenome]
MPVLQRRQQRQVVDLAIGVGKAVGHGAHEHHRHVVGRPVGRLEPQVIEFLGHQRARLGAHPRDPRVHAGRVAVEYLAFRGRQRGQLALDALRRKVAADGLVERHHGLAQHLGHAALGAAPRHLHLEQAVLRYRVTVAIEDAVNRIGIHMRHAIAVPADRGLPARRGRSASLRSRLTAFLGVRAHRRAGRQGGGQQHLLLHLNLSPD